jgi:uncharacterized protein Yka (UPF0111/DUF47 family)
MQVRQLKKSLLVFAATAVFASVAAAAPAPRAAGQSEHDFVKEASGLLEEAKMISTQLRRDAAELHALARGGSLTWQSHAGKLETIKSHVNSAGQLVRRLNDIRHVAAPWQQEAVDRVTPMLSEIASNTQWAIEHLNQNRNRLFTPEYKEYVATISAMASEMAELVSEFVEYEQTKGKLEQLETSLEVSS